jgi:hypothetical protein
MKPIRAEIEIEDRKTVEVIDVTEHTADGVLKQVRLLAQLDDLFVFERDKDEPIGIEIERLTVLSLHAHRCRKVAVKVGWSHEVKEHHFSPAAHIHRVLLWAIGKHGFDLDEMARAKANLIIPGTESPLPKDAVVGSFVRHGECGLTLELTLKDFTNG